jgi:hypothetical protein
MRINFSSWAVPVVVALGSACESVSVNDPPEPPGQDTAMVALSTLGVDTYLGFEGGLYPLGSNDVPLDHAETGIAAARLIRPLNTSGLPSASGKIVLLSIGMSNTTQEFCQPSGAAQTCQPQTFGGLAAADSTVNQTTLEIVDGAAGGQTASTWDSAGDANYNRVRDQRLAPRGLSERQVQVVWLKVANANPTFSLPDARADAYRLVAQIGDVVRAARVRYPNLRQVFISSRIFAGYATTPLNPEPFAYESGFAVKWVVQAQIEQHQQGRIVDARAADLRYPNVAPWIAWGPYLWANGMQARPDGVFWERDDLANDGTHPSPDGQRKVGTMLIGFFKTSAFTRCWFVTGLSCA